MKPLTQFESIEKYKSFFNIGMCLDIPTGYWIDGIYGEKILMGGLGPLTAISGPGKMYKSTILEKMLITAMARIWVSGPTTCTTFDTESNKHIDRLSYFANKNKEFENTDIIEEGYWVISDASRYYGDEWWEITRKYIIDKKKNAREYLRELPYLGSDGKPVKEPCVSFCEIDSISGFMTNNFKDLMDKNNIGENSASHAYMKDGLAKAQMLGELPYLAARAKQYVLSTTQIGDVVNMASGPGTSPPKKKLQFLPTDIKAKGATSAYLYLQHNWWMITNCSTLKNDADKTAKYPRLPGASEPGDLDLNISTLQSIRNNSGSGGYKFDIIVSQSEGVLSSLTEFNYLKEYAPEGFAFEGNDRNYRLVLFDEESLSRTTIRQKIDENHLLRRALNITLELCQMYQFQKHLVGEDLMTPKEMLTKITERGYNFKQLLEITRGWWTYSNDKHWLYYLSTYDLLLMAKGKYHPYWLESDNITINKKFHRDITNCHLNP